MTRDVLTIVLSVAMVVVTAVNIRLANRRVATAEQRAAYLQRCNIALCARVAERPCEVCGRAFREDEPALLRLGPDGTDVFAHAFCLAPIPGSAL